MVKNFNVSVNERIQLFQVWLASINWTLGPNKLTDVEIEILSYLLYYNDFYKQIKDDSIRMDLIFSSSIKKKIRDQFNIPTQKLETYLNKLRNKGVLEKNSINSKFIIYPENRLQVCFNFELPSFKEDKKVFEKEEMELNEEDHSFEQDLDSNEQESDDLEEPEDYDFRDPFEKYFNNNNNIESEPWM